MHVYFKKTCHCMDFGNPRLCAHMQGHTVVTITLIIRDAFFVAKLF